MSTTDPRELYVAVLLPLAIEKPYTFAVPGPLRTKVGFGLRVEVSSVVPATIRD
ncbi:MAG: hypothetical protein IPJ06_06390 [Saprospiraceae bacterium]|nr:hypothetical protein [Saprospiraceae bacterium]